jgi:predicted adenine nucleotide alpha hydrolase (AANH) superfamily ATPase
LEQSEKEKTGIKTLKIGFNKVFGYYIEVSNSFKNAVPYNYVRKQTLTTGERFITEELKNLEDDILGSAEKSLAIENEIYNKKVKGYEHHPEGGERCHICFNLRLEKTAKLAKENNYDYFCSTLTVSPHKNSKIINEIALSIEKKFNIKWLPSDFKKNEGFKQSIILSKEYNLYRQDYCGCIYSKKQDLTTIS